MRSCRNSCCSVTKSSPTLCDFKEQDRLPCPLLSPGICSNSCPLGWWCHPAISSSVVPFSSYPQSFPVSGSFQMSQFFASGDQNLGVSASASVLPMNIQDWFPLGLTSLISLLSKGLSRVFSFESISSSVFSFLHTCMHAKLLQSCQTLHKPMDHSPPGSSVHGILQARILEWVAIPSSRGSSWPRNWTSIYVSCIGR